MKKQIQSISTFVLFMNIMIFCGSNLYSQEKIILSEENYIKGLPTEVIPYAECKDITLKEIQIQERKVSVNYSNNSNESFTLVIYIDFKDEMLVDYSDTSRTLTIHSNGRTLFGLSGGYKQMGNIKNGKIIRTLTTNSYGVYDIRGEEGVLYAFAVKGEVYARSILPGNQNNTETYKACSNVLVQNVKF